MVTALLAEPYTATSGPVLSVDLAAVAANTRRLAALCGGVMAVVKADGFGHGALDVARTALANGAQWLGVATMAEALALRADGLTAPILSWLNPVDADFGTALSAHIDLAVPSLQHLRAVISAAARTGVQARVHLHADIGMARDGAPPRQWAMLTARAWVAERLGWLNVAGVMGHLPCADQPDHPSNTTGRQAFAQAVTVARLAGLRPQVRHLAGTAAALADPASRLDLCRIGAGLYGIDPIGGSGLHGALTLTVPVVNVREVPSGTPVGYGHTHVTDRPTQLALLPIGYADGIPRHGTGWVQVGERRCPVAGRVSMDQIVIDVGSAPIAAGDLVTVFGPGNGGEPTVADWARWAGTIPHDIVTGIGRRVRRCVQ